MKKYIFLSLIALTSILIFTFEDNERSNVNNDMLLLVPHQKSNNQEKVKGDEGTTYKWRSGNKNFTHKTLYCSNVEQFNLLLSDSAYNDPEEVALYISLHNSKVLNYPYFSVKNRRNIEFEFALELKKAIVTLDLKNYQKLIKNTEVNKVRLGNDSIFSFFLESYTTSDFLYLLMERGYLPLVSDLTRVVSSPLKPTLKSEIIDVLKSHLLSTSSPNTLAYLNDLTLLIEAPVRYDFSNKKNLETSIASLLISSFEYDPERAIETLIFFGYEYDQAKAKVESLLVSRENFFRLVNTHCEKQALSISNEEIADMNFSYKRTFALFESQELIQDIARLLKHEQWEEYIKKAAFYSQQEQDLLTIFYIQSLQGGAPEHVIQSLYDMGIQPENSDVFLLAMQNQLGILEKHAPSFDFGYISEDGLSAIDYCIKSRCNLEIVEFLLKEKPDMKINQKSLEALNSPQYKEYQDKIQQFSSTY